MKKQIKRRPLPDSINLPENLHPVIKRVLAARQVKDMKELDYATQNLLPFASLLGIDTAINLLTEALFQQWRILIVADYDADGATSCALAMKALQQMGAKYVNYLVPNREKHGYGLSPDIVALALPYQPQLLITVDNGIASISGVQAAKKQGMRVLVTDHHLTADQLPDADAIVNPNQPQDTFPSKHLCGVGVIFYVMMALRAKLRELGWFAAQKLSEPNLANFLDLVALGTVADVVSLDYNNRILVEQGLRRIRANHCCPGIRALLQISKREQTYLVASDLAFFLGPRLNAAGRMDDMSYGIACLLSEDETTALQHAQLLENFNQERRFVEEGMQEEALQRLDKLGNPATLPIGLCLFEETWHQGVIGILAARVKDRLHRPVIIFTHAEENQMRGSARSVAGVHIRDVLANIQAQQPEIITKFGGHAMAAGLTLPKQHFDRFQLLFDAEVRKYLSVDDLQGIIFSDGSLKATDLNLELAEQLRMMTPWGQNFPEPMFDGEFELLERRVLKDKHLKMSVRPPEGGASVEVIAFYTVDKNWPLAVKQVKLAYKLDINVFRGFKNVQLRAEYVEPCG
jgi:single-stranded-DNA-specific exonuclease